MKKILFIFLLSIFMIPNVNAAVYDLDYQDYIFQPGSNMYEITSYEFLHSKFSDVTLDMYNQALNYYNLNYKESYPYFLISWDNSFQTDKFTIEDIYNFRLVLYFSSTIPTCTSNDLFRCTFDGFIYANYYEDNVHTSGGLSSNVYMKPGINIISANNLQYYSTLSYFTSNFDIFIPSFDENTYNFTINNQNYSLKAGDKLPYFYDSAFIEDNYTINLDNYEYVILNLKDYSSKEAFETNLQVKGSIGITPVYEFGTVEKDTITDLCNITYSDYTNYRFFILKNDLLNNAVYIVKECGVSGSSFKYDPKLFDVTYVTEENKNDPIITFNGKEYHTIRFDDLSNTVNKNEEEGFVPGESGSSLSGIVDNITNFTSDIWNSISSFMGLVTKFFNTLPEEFRFLSVTAFTVLVTIAIIKFIKS